MSSVSSSASAGRLARRNGGVVLGAACCRGANPPLLSAPLGRQRFRRPPDQLGTDDAAVAREDTRHLRLADSVQVADAPVELLQRVVNGPLVPAKVRVVGGGRSGWPRPVHQRAPRMPLNDAMLSITSGYPRKWRGMTPDYGVEVTELTCATAPRAFGRLNRAGIEPQQCSSAADLVSPWSG